MQRRRGGRAEDESEVNLTPMLDVVFIMLIFFIVTASFVKESGIDINRPDAQTAEKKEQGNILVAISPNNQIWIDKRQVDVRALRANIERLKEWWSVDCGSRSTASRPLDWNLRFLAMGRIGPEQVLHVNLTDQYVSSGS